MSHNPVLSDHRPLLSTITHENRNNVLIPSRPGPPNDSPKSKVLEVSRNSSSRREGSRDAVSQASPTPRKDREPSKLGMMLTYGQREDTTAKSEEIKAPNRQEAKYIVINSGSGQSRNDDKGLSIPNTESQVEVPAAAKLPPERSVEQLAETTVESPPEKKAEEELRNILNYLKKRRKRYKNVEEPHLEPSPITQNLTPESEQVPDLDGNVKIPEMTGIQKPEMIVEETTAGAVRSISESFDSVPMAKSKLAKEHGEEKPKEEKPDKLEDQDPWPSNKTTKGKEVNRYGESFENYVETVNATSGLFGRGGSLQGAQEPPAGEHDQPSDEQGCFAYTGTKHSKEEGNSPRTNIEKINVVDLVFKAENQSDPSAEAIPPSFQVSPPEPRLGRASTEFTGFKGETINVFDYLIQDDGEEETTIDPPQTLPKDNIDREPGSRNREQSQSQRKPHNRSTSSKCSGKPVRRPIFAWEPKDKETWLPPGNLKGEQHQPPSHYQNNDATIHAILREADEKLEYLLARNDTERQYINSITPRERMEVLAIMAKVETQLIDFEETGDLFPQKEIWEKKRKIITFAMELLDAFVPRPYRSMLIDKFHGAMYEIIMQDVSTVSLFSFSSLCLGINQWISSIPTHTWTVLRMLYLISLGPLSRYMLALLPALSSNPPLIIYQRP